MSNKKLHLYSIMPLDLVHIDEVCEDIRMQYESGVTTCPLFNMTLVPEGNPPTDKAGDLSKVTGWLREKIHRHASFVKPDQLFKQVCGTFDAKYYTDYLTEKYTALYNL